MTVTACYFSTSQTDLILSISILQQGIKVQKCHQLVWVSSVTHLSLEKNLIYSIQNRLVYQWENIFLMNQYVIKHSSCCLWTILPLLNVMQSCSDSILYRTMKLPSIPSYPCTKDMSYSDTKKLLWSHQLFFRTQQHVHYFGQDSLITDHYPSLFHDPN